MISERDKREMFEREIRVMNAMENINVNLESIVLALNALLRELKS